MSSSSELAGGKLVLDEPAPNVARLKISNPEKRGALDHELLDAIAATVGSLDARCLVITGEPPMFSSGYDIGNFDDEGLSEQAAELIAHPFAEAIEAVEAYRYPVLAAINGHAIGGGLELAVTCDIRIAAHGVRLGMPPAKIGLIYSHTGLRKFIEVCGVANTNELFHVGHNIGADRGYEMGLLNAVVEPDDIEARSLEMAAEIGANAPLSLEGNKRSLRALRDAEMQLPSGVEQHLVELRESCFYSDDFREGVRAFGEKRPPRWTGH